MVCVDEDYTERLNKDLSNIEIVTERLNLPKWEKSKTETDYNRDVVHPDLIRLDTVDIRPEDGDEVEACDLLHRDGYLIHVKRYGKSQLMSHLFSQGFVSAQLLAGDSVYKENFIAAVLERSAEFHKVASEAPRRVTYAIGYANTRKLPGDLPTFSKVNLRDFARRLRGSQVEPSLCRIEIE